MEPPHHRRKLEVSRAAAAAAAAIAAVQCLPLLTYRHHLTLGYRRVQLRPHPLYSALLYLK